MRTVDRVALGWLDPGQVDGLFTISIANLYRNRSDRVDALVRVESGGLLSRGRNELAARFLDTTDSAWLLMLDSDERLDIPAFDLLIAAAHDKARPIVAGLYFAAWHAEGLYPKPVPLIFRHNEGGPGYEPIVDYPTNSLLEVETAGAGCLLIHRSVLQAFRDAAGEHDGPDWCFFRDMPIGGLWLSEDHYFCARARQLGFSVWAHTGAVLPHRKRYWLTDAHHAARLRAGEP